MFTSKFTPLQCALAVAVSLAGFGVSTAQAQSLAGQARVIVNYQAGSAAAVLAAVARLGGRVVIDLSEVNAAAVTMPSAKLAALNLIKGVESVENDSMQTIQGARSRVGSRAAQGVASGSQQVPYGITQVQANLLPAASSNPNFKSKTVCIVDSGINATHEDLAGNSLNGKNYTTSGTWDSDENSHGTHVAGTVAGLNNSVGVVGVAPNKELKLFISKVFDAAGSSASSIIAKGMLGCLMGRADVVSMSLGGGRFGSALQQKVATLLTSKNMLLIAAAGNGGTSAVSYPAGFAEVVSVAAVDANKAWAPFSQFNADVEIAGPGVGVLSTIPPNIESMGTLSVGESSFSVIGLIGSPRASATGPLADFGLGDTPVAGSMTGKVCLISRGTIDFSAKVLNCQTSGGLGAVIYNNVPDPINPTLGDVVTTIPSLFSSQADGATLLTKLGQSATAAVVPNPALYAEFDGTSMSTPHVSAVAALVWSHFPSCTAAQIRAHLTASALDIGDPGRDDKTGAGLVQAKAMFDRITALGCGAPG